MPKNKERNSQQSKGERRNVAIRNRTRGMVKFNVDAMMQSWHDKQLNAKKNPKLREKYEFEERCEGIAASLFEQYAAIGVTWGQCMQAAKTDTISTFHHKYGNKLKNFNDNQRQSA